MTQKWSVDVHDADRMDDTVTGILEQNVGKDETLPTGREGNIQYLNAHPPLVHPDDRLYNPRED